MALPQRPPSLPPPPIRSLPPTLSDARQRTLTGRRVQPAAEGLRHGSAALACSSRSAEPSRSSVVRCWIVGQRVTLCAVWHAAWYSGVFWVPKGYVVRRVSSQVYVAAAAGVCSRRSS